MVEILPRPAIRAIHAGLGNVEQIALTCTVPVVAIPQCLRYVSATIQRAFRTLKPYCSNRRDRDPFMLACQTLCVSAYVRFKFCFGFSKIDNGHDYSTETGERVFVGNSARIFASTARPIAFASCG